MTGNALRIVVAAPLEGARQALRRLAEAGCGWQVVAEAGDGLAAITSARSHHADVLLVDGTIAEPDLAGIRRLVSPNLTFLVVGLVEHPTELAADGVAVLKSAPVGRIRQTVVEGLRARLADAPEVVA